MGGHEVADQAQTVVPVVPAVMPVAFKFFNIWQLLASLGKWFVAGVITALALRGGFHINDYMSASVVFDALVLCILWRVWKWSGYKAKSRTRRVLIAVCGSIVACLAIGAVSNIIGFTLLGITTAFSQPAFTPVVEYAPTSAPTVDIAEQNYLAGVNIFVSQFKADSQRAAALVNNPEKNFLSAQYRKWHNDTLDAIAKVGVDYNAVYGLNPSPKYIVAHERLLNSAYNFQQYTQAYLNYFATTKTLNPDGAQLEKANSFYLLYLREWNLFSSEMLNTTR